MFFIRFDFNHFIYREKATTISFNYPNKKPMRRKRMKKNWTE